MVAVEKLIIKTKVKHYDVIVELVVEKSFQDVVIDIQFPSTDTFNLFLRYFFCF